MVEWYRWESRYILLYQFASVIFVNIYLSIIQTD
nr:MAG TPA: hypothetical protein [Caudoviricetes sp.]